MRKVKYIVGEEEAYGDNEPGDVVDAYLLSDDSYLALLFHPVTKAELKNGYCSCVAFGIAVDYKRTQFKALYSDEVFVNLSGSENRMFERMIKREMGRQKRGKK